VLELNVLYASKQLLARALNKFLTNLAATGTTVATVHKVNLHTLYWVLYAWLQEACTSSRTTATICSTVRSWTSRTATRDWSTRNGRSARRDCNYSRP